MTSRVRQTLLATLTLALAQAALAQGATPVQGDRIVNVATVRSDVLPVPLDSAPAVVTVRIPTRATIELLKYAPAAPGAAAVPLVLGAYRTGPNPSDPFAPLALPQLAGAPAPIALPASPPLLVTGQLHQGDPAFLRVADADQNMDRTARETIVVTTVDDLTETGPDTGVFAGYVPTARATAGTSHDGVLQVVESSRLTASYVDASDASDVISTAGLVDPAGLVFDGASGQPVNGAQITIVDEATGLPATVLTDDGVNSFPSTVTSGGTATDGAGRVHVFPPGEYRFPFLAPGTYRFDVRPPAGWSAPSRATDAALQALPGAPFALVTPGSRGEAFQLVAGPAVRIDIPLDPASGALWVRKTASTARVGVGDFLSYEIAVTNLDPVAAAAAVTAVDTLPVGFRYQAGSARVNGVRAADPAVSGDGRLLTFALGDLAAGATAAVRIAVQVGAGVRVGVDAVNSASATSASGATSNVATAAVRVADELLATRAFLMGRVTTGACEERDGVGDEGVPGVRVFLEDGTFAVSDADGLFHFEAVRRGLHVVQLDVDSLPAGMEAVSCTQNDRFAGRAFSQLVEVQGNALWRTDFHVRRAEPAAAPTAAPPPEGGPSPGGTPAPQGSRSAVPLPPPPAEVPPGRASVSLTHRVAGRLGVEYRAAMRGLRAPLTGAQLVVTLPEGVDHEPGTSALDGAAIPDPAVEGRTLAYPLGDLPAEWSKVVTFRARAMEKMGAGEHAAIAFVSGGGQGGLRVEAPPAENALRVATEEVRGPLKFVTRPHFPSFGARLGGGDRAELARVAGKLRRIRPKHLVVVGHTDSRPIAERSRKIYADNSALSLARAESVRAFLMDSLGMTAEQIDVEGKGESEPMADNATARGRALNRRVEVHIHEPETVDVATLVQPEGKEEATSAAEGVAPGAPGVVVERASSTLPAPGPRSPAASGTAAVPGAGAAPPATGSPVATSAEAGAQSAGTSAPTAPAPKATPADGFTSPADGDLVPDRVTAVQLRLPSYLTPALAVDGQEVPADRIGYRSVDPRTGKTVYTYVGVDLGEKGSRTLTVTGKDPFGNVRLSQSATVIRTGEIASIRFLSAEGNVADGRTPVRARIELRDESGDPIRGATNLVLRGGTLRPLRLDGETLTVEDAAAGRVVRMDKDGWVLFDPVTASGSHRALLACGGATVQVETWARPELRDWILVGLAEGTAGYAAVTGNMETLEAADAPEDLYADGRVAFYAKGRIKGSWLLTLAYDSDRPAPGEGDGLFQQIDPQTYFTLYGDGSTQERDAPSIRKVYVKIERDQFYVLFGDHDTGLTVTELSRYVRKLNGVKAELRTRNIEVAAFGTQTDAIHVRDEIPGDGTSGLYRLSRGRVTPNSETVTLLTRDRFRSEVVVVARTLTRFIDYSIDFDRGTLFFREPIPSRDLEFNPITIVVEYETVASGEDVTLGGRAGVRLLDDRLRAGVTAVHEGQGDVQNDLYGADLRLDLGTHTRLRGELALTDERGPGADGGGNAYLAEVAHASRRLEAKAYFRLQETGFGLGQQALSEAGTRKYGVEARYRFTDRLSLGGQAYQQDTFATGAERLVGEARLAYASGPWSGHVGLLQASDQLADGSRHDSGQINVGGKLLALKDRLTLGVDWAQSVWGNDNVDFPTRVALRAEYKLTSAIALTAAEELTWGDEATTQTTRLGLRSSLWKGGSLTSSVARDLREDDSRIFGNVGLRQTLQLSDAWKVDAGLERSQTVLEDGWYQPNPAVPPAHGTTGEDFTAISAGGSYQVPRLVWDSRAELRLGSDEDKLSVLTGVVAERQGGWGFSGRGQVLATRGDAGDTTSGNLRFGLVYRPARTRWILLNRLDWLLERGVPTVGGPAPGDLARADSWRIVDNFLANHRPRKDLQVSLGYGAKWVHQRIEGEVHEGYTDQGSLEVRYDLSPGWDLGLRGSLLHVWNAGQLSFSGGPSVGYSPATNVWLGVGFNVSGYEDRDLSASSHTAYGPWVRMRFKFDQESVREAAAWLNRQ